MCRFYSWISALFCCSWLVKCVPLTTYFVTQMWKCKLKYWPPARSSPVDYITLGHILYASASPTRLGQIHYSYPQLPSCATGPRIPEPRYPSPRQMGLLLHLNGVLRMAYGILGTGWTSAVCIEYNKLLLLTTACPFSALKSGLIYALKFDIRDYCCYCVSSHLCTEVSANKQFKSTPNSTSIILMMDPSLPSSAHAASDSNNYLGWYIKGFGCTGGAFIHIHQVILIGLKIRIENDT